MTGFEPATSGTTIRRSNQLSYLIYNKLILVDFKDESQNVSQWENCNQFVS